MTTLCGRSERGGQIGRVFHASLAQPRLRRRRQGDRRRLVPLSAPTPSGTAGAVAGGARARFAPDFASTLQARWRTLQAAFRKWHGPHSIVFLRKEEDGAYAYKVAWGDRVVLWQVAPLDDAGRITGLAWEEGG